MSSFREYRDERLKDPAFRAEYEAPGAEFEFIESLIAARLAAGLTQAELAERLGTKQPAVARLESGAMPPSLDMLKRLAKALNVRFEITPRETIEVYPVRSPA